MSIPTSDGSKLRPFPNLRCGKFVATKAPQELK